MRLCLCFLLVVSLLGCSHVVAHKTSPAAPAFEDSRPRELRAVVLTPDAGRIPAIERLVAEASDALWAQVGIGIRVTDWRVIDWQARGREEALRQVMREMDRYDEPYDIAVAFHGFGLPELLQYVLFGAWEGVIDDGCRRFIVIRRMTAQVLLHEICHGFLFSTVHSWGFRHLMTPVTFYAIPGVLPLNRSLSLKEKDRREILKNKWRDFAIAPDPCLPQGMRAGR